MCLLVRLVRTKISLEIKHFIGNRQPVVVEISAEDNLSVVASKFWEKMGNDYIYTEQRLFVFKVGYYILKIFSQYSTFLKIISSILLKI